MFERFTERARQVVVLAQDEARALGHEYIGTEHVLLGLLREEEGLAARTLAALGVTVAAVRAEIDRIVGRGDAPVAGQIPFTPAATRALELSLREAVSLGHSHIGTEHILLGLVREEDGVAAQVLVELGAHAERVRNEVIRLLSLEAPHGGVYFPSAPAFEEPFAELHRATSGEGWTGYAPAPPSEPPPVAAELSLRVIVLGWLLGVATLGLGLLLGWLIWG